jgi:hypothetical protein
MPTIEFVAVADRAEAVNGKLYMLGGCWDRMTVQGPEHAALLSLAIAILVGPDETDREWSLNVSVVRASEPGDVRFSAEAQFQAHNPAPDELQSQRVIVALPTVPVTFPATGTYHAIARLEGAPPQRTSFFVRVDGSPNS